MNRVSDAMRRAGRHQDEAIPATEEAAFAASEETPAVDASGDVPPPDEHADVEDDTTVRGELVRTNVSLPLDATAILPPIETIRIDAGEDVRLQDVLRVLWRRKWMIAAVLALGVSAAVLYNHNAVRVYQAEARVLIDPTSQDVVQRTTRPSDPGRHDYFVTQLEVLRSRMLAKKVLERLGTLSADTSRQSGQVGQLLAGLWIEPTKSEFGESRVVSITYTSPDPARASALANAFAETYVEYNLDTLRGGSQEASTWLRTQLDDLGRDVQKRAGALQDYRERQDAVGLKDEQNIIVAQYEQLSTAATSARAERVAKESQSSQLELLRQNGLPLDTFPAIQSNGFIQGLKSEVARLEAERKRLGETFQDAAPEMETNKVELDNVRTRLDLEMQKVVAGIRNDTKNAIAHENELLADLKRQERAVLDLNRKSIPYGALEREANSSQTMYEVMLQKFKETELTEKLPTNNVRIHDLAEVPGAPVSPRTQLNLALGMIMGGFLGVALAFTVEYMHPRIAEPEDVAAALGLPLLGAAPPVGRIAESSAALAALPSSFQEAIRNIRTQILLSGSSRGTKTLAITSARAGEGKTLVSSSLAISIAKAGRRVLLIDADLRRAQLCSYFDVPRSPGLSNVLMGAVKPSSALVESSVKGLYILSAGDDVPNPADLLDSNRLNQFVQGLRQVFDVVLIDCPPVMAVADASIIANAASSVVFVVRSGSTSRAVAQNAIARLTSVQARVIGVVLNRSATAGRVDHRSPYYASPEPSANT